VEALSAE